MRTEAEPGARPRGGQEWRVLLADADQDLRSALRLLLRREPCLRVVGEAANAQELVASASQTCPDLVLLDWELPGLHSGGAFTTLRVGCPHTAVVVLSVSPERRRNALSSGASAFVSKADPPGELLLALRNAVGASPLTSYPK